MSTRSVVLVAVLSAVISGAACFAVGTLVIERGPAGPAGPAGPVGPTGSVEVSTDDVVRAAEDDPGAVAGALSGFLDYEDIQQNLDPDPSDVESELRDVADRLDSLCLDLSISSDIFC